VAVDRQGNATLAYLDASGVETRFRSAGGDWGAVNGPLSVPSASDVSLAVGANGAAAVVWWARLSATALQTQAAVRAPGAASFLPSRMRILVVDDDPLLIRSLRDALEGDGHKVTTAGGGQEGIDMFRSMQQRTDSFDVVITDLGMPYVDGRKVASAIKAASPSTPVILLTGWGQRLVAENDVPMHVDHVLDKPPKLRKLREALARCSPQIPV